MPGVRIEFYGLARLRAGRPALLVEAATVGDALAAADAACPGLAAVRDGRLSPHYLLSVGGDRFTAGLGVSVAAGDSLVLLGADAGG